MSFKNITLQFVSSTAGFLAALLLYHYRNVIVHTIAYGIPWHSKYFWPIGPKAWILPILLAGIVGLYFGFKWAMSSYSAGAAIFVMLVGFFGSLVTAFGSFRNGYILLGLFASAAFITCLWTMYREES